MPLVPSRGTRSASVSAGPRHGSVSLISSPSYPSGVSQQQATRSCRLSNTWRQSERTRGCSRPAAGVRGNAAPSPGARRTARGPQRKSRSPRRGRSHRGSRLGAALRQQPLSDAPPAAPCPRLPWNRSCSRCSSVLALASFCAGRLPGRSDWDDVHRVPRVSDGLFCHLAIRRPLLGHTRTRGSSPLASAKPPQVCGVCDGLRGIRAQPCRVYEPDVSWSRREGLSGRNSYNPSVCLPPVC